MFYAGQVIKIFSVSKFWKGKKKKLQLKYLVTSFQNSYKNVEAKVIVCAIFNYYQRIKLTYLIQSRISGFIL